MRDFPEIQTERLEISALRAEDIPLIVKYAGNQKIADNTLYIPHPYTEADAVYWLNMANGGRRDGTNLTLAIRLRPDNQFIGGIGFTIDQRNNRAELGYWLAEPFWNQGLVTEAARALLRYAFEELNLQKVTSSHFAHNPASGRVQQKIGLRQEGVLAQHVLKNGEYISLVLYGLTSAQYAGSPAPAGQYTQAVD